MLRNRKDNSDAVRAAAITEMSPVALIGLGLDGEIESWNPAAKTLLEWEAEDVIGRTVTEVLGTNTVPMPETGSGVKRVRTFVSSSSGRQVDVELLVEAGAAPSENAGEHVIAVVPVATKQLFSASPRIESWSEAARVIGGLGGTVHCVALGLVGVEAVNRGYSRSAGDTVLIEVATRLEQAVGSSGRVLRVSGNQFVVAVRSDVELDGERLVRLLSEPVETRLGTVRIGCYAGVFTGDSVSGRVVLDRADSAMRRAQERGIGAVESLSHEGPTTEQRHPRLSSLLIDAVARREIDVAFQPVVELKTGRIFEFEALARWNSSELGAVEPSAFIEAAEDNGLIHELGQIVLGRSLDVVQAEVKAGRWEDRRVSVNLSAVQLSHPDLGTRIVKALAARSLPGEVLQLELTETRMFADIAATAAVLSKLRDVGVGLTIDDFGTGSANLGYLRDLPIDTIKVDGRFIAALGTSLADTAVIRAIGSLAADLHLDVIAERVETPAQHFALARLGYAAAQGFLYAGGRGPADLYAPIALPDRPQGQGFPYPDDEAGRIDALHFADVLDTPAEEEYDEIVREAAEICGTPISLVSLIDDDRQWFKAKVGLDVDETPRHVAFCAHAICAEDLMEVPDALADERFSSNPLVLGDPNIRFYAGVPLRSVAGHNYGTLCVIDTTSRELTPEQRDRLIRLARQVTLFLELREMTNRVNHANVQLALVHSDAGAAEAGDLET